MNNINYPVLYTIENNGEDGFKDYTISVDNTVVYSGRIYFRNSSDDETIDLSPILKEYIDVFYEDIIYPAPASSSVQSLPVKDQIRSINKFVVETEGSAETYDVVYNYNTDRKTESGSMEILNAPISLEVDRRQYLFLSAFDASGGSVSYSYSTSNGLSGNTSQASEQIQLYALNLNQLSIPPGNTITMTVNGKDETYQVLEECRSRYALYYVNKYGGFDSILMSGKAVENWNPSRVDVRVYNDRSNSRSWEQKRLLTEITKGYELNTGYLESERAREIDNLIYSPKVFIHDLESGAINACLINDSSYRTKEFRYDKMFNYTVNVIESQLQIRR